MRSPPLSASLASQTPTLRACCNSVNSGVESESRQGCDPQTGRLCELEADPGHFDGIQLLRGGVSCGPLTLATGS